MPGTGVPRDRISFNVRDGAGSDRLHADSETLRQLPTQPLRASVRLVHRASRHGKLLHASNRGLSNHPRIPERFIAARVSITTQQQGPATAGCRLINHEP